MSLAQIVKASLYTPLKHNRWGLPLLLEGQPGVGKSAILEQICAQSGLQCETLTASDRDPTDFSGLPFPNKDHTKITRLVEGWMARMFEWERGVVFIDELSTLPGVLQAVLLRGVREGVWGGREAPKGVRFISAMNPSEIASGGHKISQPLANRFGWIDFMPPTPTAWAEYMMGTGTDNVENPLNAADEEKRVMAAWPNAYATSVGAMTSAVLRLNHLLFSKPQNGDPKASRAWASPRTMEMATRAMASGIVHNLSQADADMFMASFIGDDVASEIIAYRNKQDLPDPSEILDGKEKFVHSPKRIDRTWAVMNSCTTLLVPTNCENRTARAKVMWDMLGDIAEDVGDIAAAPTRQLLKAGLAKGQKGAFVVLKKLSPMLEAAGINWQDKQD